MLILLYCFNSDFLRQFKSVIPLFHWVYREWKISVDPYQPAFFGSQLIRIHTVFQKGYRGLFSRTRVTIKELFAVVHD